MANINTRIYYGQLSYTIVILEYGNYFCMMPQFPLISSSYNMKFVISYTRCDCSIYDCHSGVS